METNNGTEAQNKALKYKYLPRKAISLSHVVTIIIEQFLPEQHRKYLFLNFQMDPTYRAYTTHVPSYLQGRQRNVILHCLAREEKARKTFSHNDITDTDKKRKVSTLRMLEATFEKHVYGKEKRQSLEEFDPCPIELRGTANERLPELLDKLRGKGLSISLEGDQDHKDAVHPELPSKQDLQRRVAEFKKCLK